MSYPAHKIANDDANDKEPHALPHNLEVEQGLLGQLLGAPQKTENKAR